jgi:LmbE family N-acetylglucosaminyl deacetylase
MSFRGEPKQARAYALAAAIMLAGGCASGPSRAALLMRPNADVLEVHVAERALLIALHPGDETVAAAGLAQRVLKRVGGFDTLVLANGESAAASERERRSEAKARSREARAAAAISSKKLRLHLLGVPDTEVAAMSCGREFQAALPDAACPRDASLPQRGRAEPSMSRTARSLLDSIRRELDARMPTLLVFPDPREGPPDQRAVGVLSLLALREHMRGRDGPWPRALTFVVGPSTLEHVYNADAPPPEPPLCLALNDRERETKRRALASYRSQRRVLPAFARDDECFVQSTRLDVEMAALRMYGKPAAGSDPRRWSRAW